MSDPKKGSVLPSKSRDKSKRDKLSFDDYRFVRIELTEAEKSEFRGQLAAGEFETVDVDDWLARGNKLTLTRDTKGGGVLASLSQQNVQHSDAGLILTARGGTVALALAVLSFKDGFIAGDDGWRACETARGGSYDDIG